MALQTPNLDQKAQLLDMATLWEQLAEQGAKQTAKPD